MSSSWTDALVNHQLWLASSGILFFFKLPIHKAAALPGATLPLGEEVQASGSLALALMTCLRGFFLAFHLARKVHYFQGDVTREIYFIFNIIFIGIQLPITLGGSCQVGLRKSESFPVSIQGTTKATTFSQFFLFYYIPSACVHMGAAVFGPWAHRSSGEFLQHWALQEGILPS